jgi:hypothetical protein
MASTCNAAAHIINARELYLFIRAEFELFEYFLVHVLTAGMLHCKGNAFAQGQHDDVTLEDSNGYTAYGLECMFDNRDWTPAFGFPRSTGQRSLFDIPLLAIDSSTSAAGPVPAQCQVPQNCGQYNNSTVCGHKFTGCEFVCRWRATLDAATHANIRTGDTCNSGVAYECPTPPPPSTATTDPCLQRYYNYHELWCTVTNISESSSALATRLHVNPTKLCEYSFLYECGAGVTPGNSIRVPYDQDTSKLGA